MNLIEEVEGLVAGKIEIIKTLLSLIKLETRLARLSIYPLLINLLMMLIVLMTVWISCMLLLGCILMMVHLNLVKIMLIILLINLIFLFLLSRLLMANLNKMSFEKTRSYFTATEEHHHGQLKKTDN